MKKLRVFIALLLCLLLCGCGELLPTLPTVSDVVIMPDTDCVPYASQRYFLQQLDEEEFINFCAMYQSVTEFKDTCKLPYPTEERDIDALVRLLQYECPELIQLDFTQTIYYTLEDDQVVKLQLPISMDEEEYEEKYSACEEIAEELLSRADQAPDPEKAVYDYITDHCTYDAQHPDAATVYGVLVEGYGKCDGISLTYKWLLEQMGSTCLCIAGDPVDGGIGHAWNVVEIDGEFYDVDVTADTDPADQETRLLYPAYHVSENWIRDRYYIDPNLTAWGDIPGSTSMEESYHVRENNFIRKNETPELEQKFLDAYRQENSFTFQFADRDGYDDFMDALQDNVETIAKDNKLNGWKYEYQTQEEYQIVQITVGKP